MKIRKTKPEELKLVMKLYENARSFMAAHGNPLQWGTSHPGEDLILRDIEEGNSYVCEEHGAVTAVFYYREGSDPTYARIYDRLLERCTPILVNERNIRMTLAGEQKRSV